MSIQDFENLRYIPGNLEGLMHVQSCGHAQEWPEKALIFHL